MKGNKKGMKGTARGIKGGEIRIWFDEESCEEIRKNKDIRMRILAEESDEAKEK